MYSFCSGLPEISEEPKLRVYYNSTVDKAHFTCEFPPLEGINVLYSVKWMASKKVIWQEQFRQHKMSILLEDQMDDLKYGNQVISSLFIEYTTVWNK